MRASLVLIGLGALALNASAAMASAPDVPGLDRLANPLAANAQIPAANVADVRGSLSDHIKVAAMNTYMTAKGQKSGSIKRRSHPGAGG